MFKKISALLLLTAFTNVYAFSPVLEASAISNELNKTFDSLNYKLNVEWNQKDAKFFDATIADFEKEITALQEEGVTNQDLIKYTTDKIKDKEIQNDINGMSKVIADTQMSNEEARAFIVSRLSSTYSHGASWSGSRMGVHTAIIIGAIILILICAHRHHSDSTTPTTPTTPVDPCAPQDMGTWSQNDFTGGQYNGCYGAAGFTSYQDSCCPSLL